VRDSKLIAAAAGLTDEEVMGWLDNIEGSQPEDTA
jgi:hypothetical protein